MKPRKAKAEIEGFNDTYTQPSGAALLAAMNALEILATIEEKLKDTEMTISTDLANGGWFVLLDNDRGRGEFCGEDLTDALGQATTFLKREPV